MKQFMIIKVLLFEFIFIFLYSKVVLSSSVNTAILYKKKIKPRYFDSLEIVDDPDDTIINENNDQVIFESSEKIIKYWTNEEKEEFEDQMNEEEEDDDEEDKENEWGSGHFELHSLTKKFSFYEQLEYEEKLCYDAILSHSKKHNPDLKINFAVFGITDMEEFHEVLKESIERIFTVLVYENPELWWIGTYRYKLSATTYNQCIITFIILPKDSPFYGITSKEISNINDEIEKIKTNITTEITNLNLTSSYAIIRYIHDYLIKNIVYSTDSKSLHIRTIYGALVENKCVCEGYAEAFEYLLKQFQIRCIIARSISHEWNFVEIHNKWYIVDVTYDDPVLKGIDSSLGSDKNLSYNYFLIGTKHKINGHSSKKYSDDKAHKLVYSGFTDNKVIFYPKIESKDYIPSEIEKKEIESIKIPSILGTEKSGIKEETNNSNDINNALSLFNFKIVIYYNIFAMLIIALHYYIF
ncbi:hypothetical protein BCR32DRAFT_272553 [Anaeromyces robustus]|uniref:Transglutaminase-like domain-containing protein n=1 Tax=Anaeromyces robustus TaxID=1754192 RepID=A0A1Y1W347_9FUNG|nr:hypothetical protein BCR32DRAFT_272553 [Anaeromyces robustus]|eukprot:ORX67715.1 hypothetical protein BCR32DRAFT_272553 [Anaeromyces robustus]